MKDRRRHNSVGFHLHYWRGFKADVGLLVAYVTVGFVTFSAEDIDLIIKANKMYGHLKDLLPEGKK